MFGFFGNRQQFRERLIDVEDLNLRTRHHHQAANQIIKLENVVQQIVFVAAEISVDRCLSQEGANFFFGVRRVVTGAAAQSQPPKDDFGCPVQHPHKREQDVVEELHPRSTPAHHLFWLANCKNFRSLLADHKVQCRHDGKRHDE